MKACSCDDRKEKRIENLRPGGFPREHPREIYCSNCNGLILCDFGDQAHAAQIVWMNSRYSCRDHKKLAEAEIEKLFTAEAREVPETKKCRCTTPSHNHPDNKCQKDATHPEDDLCDDCHKKAADEFFKTDPGPRISRRVVVEARCRFPR